MLTKNKHQRSEWFEGLLWAEKVLKYRYNKNENLFLEHTDGLDGYIAWGRGRVQDNYHIVKSRVSLEFGQGVIDYLSLFDK